MNEYMNTHSCDILMPVYNSRQGHPVLINNDSLCDLMSYKGDGGLRGAINNYQGEKRQIPLSDKGIVLDADNPDDYKQLQKYYASQNQVVLLSLV